jgi:hypothetical protein
MRWNVDEARRRWTVTMAIVLVTALPLPVASAQESLTDDSWYQYSFTPRFTTDRVAEALAKIESLGDDERAVIEALHEDFLRSFDDQSRAYRTEVEEGFAKRMRDRDGRHRFGLTQAFTGGAPTTKDYDAGVQQAWRAAKPEVERRFEDEVASVLNAAQRAVWESEVRRLRRTTALSTEMGQLMLGPAQGCGDLVAAAEAALLTPSERAASAPLIVQFEMDLDAILAESELRAPRLNGEYVRLVSDDPERVKPETLAALSELQEYGQQVRIGLFRTCLQSRDAIAGTLTASRDAFLEEAGKRMWPELYGESPVEHAVRLIHEDPARHAGRVASLNPIESAYRERRRAIYARIEATLADGWNKVSDPSFIADFLASRHAFEEEAKANPTEFMVFDGVPGIGDWRDRFLLNLRTIRQIRSLFSPDEIETLPAALRLALAFEYSPAD